MAQRILNNGDANALIRTNINDNFAEVYADKHAHTNKAVVDQLTQGHIDALATVGVLNDALQARLDGAT